jgi:hypothetical protein
MCPDRRQILIIQLFWISRNKTHSGNVKSIFYNIIWSKLDYVKSIEMLAVIDNSYVKINNIVY